MKAGESVGDADVELLSDIMQQLPVKPPPGLAPCFF